MAEEPAIDLDSEAARRKKAERAWRLNVVQYPMLRLWGHLTLQALVYVYLRFLVPDPDWTAYAWLASLTGLYVVVSWGLLYRFYQRITRFDFQVVFLALDVLIYTASVYVTGGDRSWLWIVMFVRVADQTNTGFLRVLLFGHYSLACYAFMLAWIALVDHRSVDWGLEAVKMGMFYVLSLYLSLTARTAEALRARTRAAMRVARDVIGQLDDARARAEEASRAKSVFLAAISHELRTPLNAILGSSEYLIEASDAEPQEREEFLQHIQDGGRRLLTMVNDILDLVQEEETDSREVVAVAEFLERMRQDLMPRVRDRGLRLRVDASRAPKWLRTDPRRLRQALRCLTDNALKFTPSGGDVEVTAHQADGVVRFEVHDTGPGIPPEQMERVFDVFYQIDRTRERAGEGVGLGLAVARRAARTLGGDVALSSVPGKGTVATLTVPLHT